MAHYKLERVYGDKVIKLLLIGDYEKWKTPNDRNVRRVK